MARGDAERGGGMGVRGFCDSWFWFCSPVLWHSLLSSHGHLTLFLMMCAVCASYRDNTHGKYLENAAQSPLSSPPLSAFSCHSQLQFIITAPSVFRDFYLAQKCEILTQRQSNFSLHIATICGSVPSCSRQRQLGSFHPAAAVNDF